MDQSKKKEGIEGIQELGHREYVGGLWDEVGKLQFEFMVGQGLRPAHCLLDIACGALRGGVHFIRYLEPGNYLGIDKEETLISLGIEKELGRELFQQKRPQFVTSDCFEFSAFTKKPQYSLAQSLFTHLTGEHIGLCLRRLRRWVTPGHLCYATFFEGQANENPATSHSHACFRYRRQEMAAFAGTGWNTTYLGNWNHPRGQVMMHFEAV